GQVVGRTPPGQGDGTGGPRQTVPGSARVGQGATGSAPATVDDRYAAGQYASTPVEVSEPDMSQFDDSVNVQALNQQACLQDQRYGKGAGDSFRNQAALVQAGGPQYANLPLKGGGTAPNPWIGVTQQRQTQEAENAGNLEKSHQIAAAADAWRQQSADQQQVFR